MLNKLMHLFGRACGRLTAAWSRRASSLHCRFGRLLSLKVGIETPKLMGL